MLFVYSSVFCSVLLDILIISSSGDPNLEPPKISTEPFPLDVIKTSKVEEVTESEQTNEQASVTEATSTLVKKIFIFILNVY